MALQKQTGKTIHRLIEDDGTFPNNGLLPLLAYQGVLELTAGDPARAEVLVRKHFTHSCRYALQGDIRVNATLLRDHGLANPDRR